MTYRLPLALVAIALALVGVRFATHTSLAGSGIRLVNAAMSRVSVASEAALPTPTVSSSGQALPPKIGFNLTALVYWSVETPLLNRFKMGIQWNNRGGTEKPPIAAQLTADGWPRAMPPAGIWEMLAPLDPIGAHQTTKFVLRWKGTGTIKISQVGSQTSGDHRITFENSQGGCVLLGIFAIDPKDPIRDISIVRADQVADFDRGVIFDPKFVDRIIKPFSIFRTMDWDMINTSGETEWADRQKPGDAFWMRMPLEMEVALANAGGSDLWKTIPSHASDDYVRRTVTYIRDHLSPELKLHLEYSNEVWNGIFPVHAFAAQEAKTRWGTAAFEANTYYGYRAAQVASIAWSIFGANNPRLRPVLSGWFAWSGRDLTDAMTQGVDHAGVGTVGSLFREYAVAPYFGDALGPNGANAADQATVLNWARDETGKGLDQAFAQLEHGGLLSQNSSLDEAKNRLEPQHAAFAQANNLDLVAYEGGLSFYYFNVPATDKPILQAFFQKMVDDPRMATLYARWARDFAGNGGRRALIYNDIGSLGEYGPYGTLPDLYARDTRRYGTLKALAALNPGP